MDWRTWGWIVAVVWLAVACGNGEPGTPGNHPVLWLVGGAVGLGLLAVAAWYLTGVSRRHDRREDRDDRRDERRGGEPKG